MKYLKKYKLFESELFDEESDQLDILSMEDYENGDYHQAILNLGYFKWQKNDWSYQDMVDYIGKKYHPDFKLMILLGKYNQQVNNGGHYQYLDNGYASGGGGAFAEKNGIGLHEEMMELFKKSLLFKRDEVCNKVYQIMLEFEEEASDYGERCPECEGQGYIEEDCYTCNGNGYVESEGDCPECNGYGMIDDEECSNCDGNGYVMEEEDCEECGGSGQIDNDCDYCEGTGETIMQLDHLDNKYYKLDNEFMDVCNEYSKILIDAVIVRPRNLARKANGL
jgi:hypothetical protein